VRELLNHVREKKGILFDLIFFIMSIFYDMQDEIINSVKGKRVMN
jgi:hypothetical protein